MCSPISSFYCIFVNYFVGSKYFENERKKEEQVTKRIEEQRQKMKVISSEQLEIAEKEVRIVQK